MKTVIMLVVLVSPTQLYAATMTDYCINPPLIGVPTKPNLLLMLDNSSSMFDLTYVDEGKPGTCSIATTKTCYKNADCLTGEGTCIGSPRDPEYCYDQTYKSTNDYFGYFDKDTFYQYDATNRDFFAIAAFPADADCTSPSTLKKITNPTSALYICHTASDVTIFVAKGNYLNWLTASKFDVQKEILTGGKYVTKVCSNAVDTSCIQDADCPSGGACGAVANTFLQGESRGCVGRGFVKEALTADFVNYADFSSNPNTSLGITFNIKGPVDATNPTAPSPGGQTSIGVLLGNYNQELCQDAIDALEAVPANLGTIKSTLDDCLSSTAATDTFCQLDPSKAVISSCSKNSDCTRVGFLCSVFETGVCGLNPGTGTCTANNGTCPAGKKCIGGTTPGGACSNIGDCAADATACSKACLGGGYAGNACSSDAGCIVSTCTAGRPAGTICTTNSGCDTNICTNAGRSGLACTTDSNCNVSSCSGLPSGLLCSINSDCNNFGPCVSPSATTVSKTKVVFNQSMQACWAYDGGSGTDIGTDEVNTVKNQCNDIYGENKTCIGGDNNGRICASIADCPGVGADCINGPDAILPGNPSYLCSRAYTGFCANSALGNWTDTVWIANGFASANDCIMQKHRDFCNVMDAPEVIDPTDAPSVTDTYDNLPAIISDIGVEAQLGQPLKNLKVRVREATPPTNLIQQFKDLIRMGAMTFNFNGSISECSIVSPTPAGMIPCPKVCSTDTSKVCGSQYDCPSPATASCTVTTNNFDGAKIVHDIGDGTCYNVDGNNQFTTQVSPVVKCTTDMNCCTTGTNCTTPASGQKCRSAGVGDHTTGLIRTIDDIRGSTWTPFAEAYYNAIGYMATDRRCNITTSARCTRDSDCPSGETCPVSTGVSRTDLRISSSDATDPRRDYDERYNPSEYMCQKNNILLISDGMPTADQRSSVSSLADRYNDLSVRSTGVTMTTMPGEIGTCTNFAGSKNLDDMAWIARNHNINTFSLTSTSPTNTSPRNSDYITTHVVFAGADSGGSDDCSSERLMDKTARSGGTILKMAQDPEELNDALEDALWDIAAGAVSGTAASVLASGEGSGANLIQAVFYPTKKFINSATGNYDEIAWTGRLTNLWYYVDPFFGNSSIREDDGDRVLDLKTVNDPNTSGRKDFVTKMYYDASTETAKAHRWADTNGDGSPDGALFTPDIEIEAISSLWEAGTLLWKRDASDRTIYTNCGVDSAICLGSTKLGYFSTANASALASALTATDSTEAANIINYVRGIDKKVCSNNASTVCTTDAGCTSPGTCEYLYRSRTVKVDLNHNGDTADTNVAGYNETVARVWKLGDILNSTPKISSWQPLNTYNKVYGDGTYGVPYQDSALGNAPNPNRFTTTSAYKDRGMVFVGGNDGMLHAFNLGKLELQWNGRLTTEMARMTGTDLGKEMWAFVPKNALPYLKYMTDTGYCHLYSVDLTPYIFDASIGSGSADESTTPKSVASWRTILIGGMRYGGACRASTGACNSITDGLADCVKTPVSNNGYSAYFALDITDQNDPKLLWEFDDTTITDAADRGLGFTTAGPVVLRMNPRDWTGNEIANARDSNGKWFVVFASGPTGPISTDDKQFLGRSDQNLKLFVLDLKSGDHLRTIDTTIQNAFAGNMVGTAFDADKDYQDDVVYIPYVKKSASGTTWTDGGVGRLLTFEDSRFGNWFFSKVTADDIGPVTATVAKLLDTEAHNMWLYFGTGRYFYEKTNSADDGTNQRHIIGLKDPCYSSSGFPASNSHSCLSTQMTFTNNLTDKTCGGLTGAALTSCLDASISDGWYIELDPAGTYGPYTDPADPLRAYNAERSVTDPSSSARGLAYFTTYKPYNDDCALTGRTYIWCAKYDTGGACGDLLTGTIVIQLSTGQIAQVDLSTAFTEAGGRKASIGIGAPPGPGGGVIAPRSAVKKSLHIKER